LPVASFEAAKIGQEPSAVSPKHPPVQDAEKPYVQDPTAAFNAALSAGVNAARTTSTINNVAATKNHNVKVHESRPPAIFLVP